ncbi:MAG: hypothetical protein DCC55_40445 [Chloroflexi bacterium]|nr:MAG: hypothetical protein DCC55_40445 [Chloroflexota bacterium]
MHLVDLPRDIRPYEPHQLVPGMVNGGIQMFDGDGLEVGGQLLTTMYLTFQGDDLYSTIALTSDDEGHTWRYLSTIAGPEAVPGAPEGPCEPGMVQLATGELMCVLRVGSGSTWNLFRSYSRDEGRTWSPVDRLPAFSVEPSLRRLHNGTLALTTGRAGIYLWLSTDPRGTAWQPIDLVAHHNTWAPSSRYTIVPEQSGDRALRHAHDQTTAYTELVEVAPNRLLMVYDRTPFGWNPVPHDSDERSRVFALPMHIERI